MTRNGLSSPPLPTLATVSAPKFTNMTVSTASLTSSKSSSTAIPTEVVRVIDGSTQMAVASTLGNAADVSFNLYLITSNCSINCEPSNLHMNDSPLYRPPLYLPSYLPSVPLNSGVTVPRSPHISMPLLNGQRRNLPSFKRKQHPRRKRKRSTWRMRQGKDGSAESALNVKVNQA